MIVARSRGSRVLVEFMVCLAGASRGSVLLSYADLVRRPRDTIFFLLTSFDRCEPAYTMSTWGVGDDHDSDEVRTLKEQIRVKGNSVLVRVPDQPAQLLQMPQTLHYMAKY